MKIGPFTISLARKSDGISIDTLIKRLEMVYATASNITVTPETCMQSPTVHAIVTAVSRRIATLPPHVFRKVTSGNRTRKEALPSHPVERLLSKPNGWQTPTSYWLDSTSRLLRYGNHLAYKAQGNTGPIKRLEPIDPAATQMRQDDDLSVKYVVNRAGGGQIELEAWAVHHVRGPARNVLWGDSPVIDVREAIALEIAAEKMGASVFGNGAMPGIIFNYEDEIEGHEKDEERRAFIDEFQRAYTGSRGRFKAMLVPKGIKMGSPINVENDKAQFLETRQYQRTVIAGAFGVPPHLVGDLTKGTFNNVWQQSISFVQNVVLPYVKMFESAMEAQLLTDEDRRSGVIIRFNLEGALRGDFKSRQEGLRIMRDAGVINPNDWREHENMNPISEEDGGETYWLQGPSGQNSGQQPPSDADEDGDDEPDA